MMKMKIYQKMNNLVLAVTLFVLATLPLFSYASETNGTIVNGPPSYAWGENLGWMNFRADNSNIAITDDAITGYVWTANYGWINLGPGGIYGGVTNDGEGVLGGYAWSAFFGPISFTGTTINDDGLFTGTTDGSGSTAGRIAFSCDYCEVRTDWRPANVREEPENDGSGGGSSGGGDRKRSVATSTTPLSPDTSTPDTDPGDQTASPADMIDTTIDTLFPKDSYNDTSSEQLPAQLFDIHFSVPQPVVPSIQDLVGQVTFESFGTETTPVDLEFAIFDSSGTQVWTDTTTTTAETEKVLTRQFLDSADLPEGNYTLRLRTLHNTNVEESFEVPFEIRTQDETVSQSWVIWLLSFCALLGGGIFFWRFFIFRW